MAPNDKVPAVQDSNVAEAKHIEVNVIVKTILEGIVQDVAQDNQLLNDQVSKTQDSNEKDSDEQITKGTNDKVSAVLDSNVTEAKHIEANIIVKTKTKDSSEKGSFCKTHKCVHFYSFSKLGATNDKVSAVLDSKVTEAKHNEANIIVKKILEDIVQDIVKTKIEEYDEKLEHKKNVLKKHYCHACKLEFKNRAKKRKHKQFFPKRCQKFAEINDSKIDSKNDVSDQRVNEKGKSKDKFWSLFYRNKDKLNYIKYNLMDQTDVRTYLGLLYR